MSNKKNIRNYLILMFIFVATFGIAMYFLGLYKASNEYRLAIPVLKDTVAEVTYDGLNEFLLERDVTVLYMGVVNDNNCRAFERKFKHYIIENNLRDDIFYFNLGDYSKNKKFLEEFYNQYKSDMLIKTISNYPLIIIFKNMKIIDILSSGEEKISVEMAKEFLADYIIIL